MVAGLSALALALAVALAARHSTASPVQLHARYNGGGAPSAVISNGTVEGVLLPTFSQDGASSLSSARLRAQADPELAPHSIPRHPLRPATGGRPAPAAGSLARGAVRGRQGRSDELLALCASLSLSLSCSRTRDLADEAPSLAVPGHRRRRLRLRAVRVSSLLPLCVESEPVELQRAARSLPQSMRKLTKTPPRPQGLPDAQHHPPGRRRRERQAACRRLGARRLASAGWQRRYPVQRQLCRAAQRRDGEADRASCFPLLLTGPPSRSLAEHATDPPRRSADVRLGQLPRVVARLHVVERAARRGQRQPRPVRPATRAGLAAGQRQGVRR